MTTGRTKCGLARPGEQLSWGANYCSILTKSNFEIHLYTQKETIHVTYYVQNKADLP